MTHHSKQEVHAQALFVRNKYARRALALKIPPDKVQRIFGLSDTALGQLELHVRNGCTDL